MNALNVFLGCMVWIPLGIWIVSLINWSILGDVDPLSGFLGVSAAIMLGIMAFKPPVPGLTPYIFCMATLSVILYPIARANMVRKELSSFDVDGIEQGYMLLGQRPTNPVARLKIAQHLYNLGHHGHAIAIAESVMKQLPERLFLDEHRMIRLWKRNPPRANAYNPISCVECGHLNPPGSVHCFKCGEPFLLHMVKGRFVPSRLGRQLVAAWIALLLLLGGIPIAATMKAELAFPMMIAVLVAAAGVAFAGFRPAGGQRN
jgi:hypothetical protein